MPDLFILERLSPAGGAVTCQSCIHRLDVTLWGYWLATGCRLGLVIRCRCDKHQGPPLT